MWSRVKQALFFAMLVCVLGTLSVQAQTGFQPVQSLTAYDSTGKRIGNVLGFEALPNVAFSKDNTTVVLGVGKERFFSTWTFLAFASTDCTGTAFIAPSQYPVPPLTLNAIRNGSVYVPDASAPPPSLPFTVRSYYDENAENPCTAYEWEITDAVQAKILGDVPSFTPPFSVR